MAAVDFFLKLDGIDGDVTVVGHEKWFEIESFSWGVSNTISYGTSGAGAGKAVRSDFSLTLPYSKASPAIFIKLVTGAVISEATLSASTASGGQTSDFLKYKLSDVFISSYNTEGSHEVPFEQISLAFSKIEVAYYVQSADGALGTITAGFDFLHSASF